MAVHSTEMVSLWFRLGNGSSIAILAALFAVRSADAQKQLQSPTATACPAQVSTLDLTELVSEARDAVAAISADGGLIAIGSASSGHLLRWDVRAKKSASVGGIGSGPGEMRSISLLAWTSDGLAVFDPVLRRAQYFAAAGPFKRSSQVSALAVFAFSRDGTAQIGVGLSGLADGTDRVSDSIAVQLARADGSRPLRNLPRRRGSTLELPVGGGSVLRMRHPAGPLRNWAFSQDGREVCISDLSADGARGSPRIDVDCRALDGGSTPWTQPLDLPRHAVPAKWVDSSAATIAADAKLRDETTEKLRVALRRRSVVNPILVAIAPEAGILWLQLRPIGARVQVMRLAANKPASRFEFSATNRLLAANGRWLLTADESDDGEVLAHLWRMDC